MTNEVKVQENTETETETEKETEPWKLDVYLYCC